MALVINGQDISESTGAIVVNSVNISEVILNGTSYWNSFTAVSPIYVDSSRSLVAGVDFPADQTVTLCMCGGGGGGGKDENLEGAGAGGGGSGVLSTSILVAKSTVLDIVIGQGGAADSSGGTSTIKQGSTTLLSAQGGGGGGLDQAIGVGVNGGGNGGPGWVPTNGGNCSATCDGVTYYGGVCQTDFGYPGGGGAGGFGNGAAWETSASNNSGAGGGGDRENVGFAGGSGRLKVSW